MPIKELHDLAMETARKHVDVGFLWEIVKALPVAEEVTGDDQRSKVDIVRPLALINDFLYDAGVKGIYGPGTPIPASAKDVLEQIKRSLATA